MHALWCSWNLIDFSCIACPHKCFCFSIWWILCASQIRGVGICQTPFAPSPSCFPKARETHSSKEECLHNFSLMTKNIKFLLFFFFFEWPENSQQQYFLCFSKHLVMFLFSLLWHKRVDEHTEYFYICREQFEALSIACLVFVGNSQQDGRTPWRKGGSCCIWYRTSFLELSCLINSQLFARCCQ